MVDEDIHEMFAGLGAVSLRRMFGGKGVYHAGLIVAVDIGAGMLLKADAVSAPLFEAAGAARWSYAGRKGKPVQMPYWSVPEAAWDDREAMAGWTRLAFEAALRSDAAARLGRPRRRRRS